MKSPLIIGHLEFSRTMHPWGRGEMTELIKVQKALNQPCEAIDVYKLFAHSPSFYSSLSSLNMQLAHAGHSIIQIPERDECEQILKTLRNYAPERVIVLSWEDHLAALLATGAQSLCPLVGKLYVLHAFSTVPLPLYDPLELVITETPLATQKGLEAGIPLTKMLYLPHSFRPTNVRPKTSYLENLARANGKSLSRADKKIVIGMCCRLRSSKNCLAAFAALKTLADSGEDFFFVLKGDFEGRHLEIAEELQRMIHYPWFLWDQSHTSFPEVLTEYAHFDILLNISGRDGANNTNIECLSMGIPCVLLEGSSNPYLFKDAALLIPIEDELGHDKYAPYCIPQMEPLIDILRSLIRDSALRAEWGRRGKEIARLRFAPEELERRLPLLFGKVAPGKLEKLHEEDRKLYGIDEGCR